MRTQEVRLVANTQCERPRMTASITVRFPVAKYTQTWNEIIRAPFSPRHGKMLLHPWLIKHTKRQRTPGNTCSLKLPTKWLCCPALMDCKVKGPRLCLCRRNRHSKSHTIPVLLLRCLQPSQCAAHGLCTSNARRQEPFLPAEHLIEPPPSKSGKVPVDCCSASVLQALLLPLPGGLKHKVPLKSLIDWLIH